MKNTSNLQYQTTFGDENVKKGIINEMNKLQNQPQSVTQIINIAIVGDAKTGKTALLECFLKESFSDKSTETVLNITKCKFSIKHFNFDLNFFDIGGYMERDKDLVKDYIKNANIILLCHSFEQEFNEENIKVWLDFIEANNSTPCVYLIGCKYDLKVMQDFQKGAKITSLMFYNGNLTSFGERIKTFINNPQNNIKSYHIASSLLNFNVQEMFNTIIKDYIIDIVVANQQPSSGNKNQNCNIF
jgi:small GTP-binding protein